jgi:hypothetical protein
LGLHVFTEDLFLKRLLWELQKRMMVSHSAKDGGILEYRRGLKIGGVGEGWSYQGSPSHCCNSIRVGGMNPEFGL